MQYDNFSIDAKGNFHWTSNAYIYSQPSKTILMQYTGLKAKGKEIYEGDIVEYEDGSRFVKDMCGAKKMLRQSKRSPGVPMSNYEPKIIGNIYENPELCKKKMKNG